MSLAPGLFWGCVAQAGIVLALGWTIPFLESRTLLMLFAFPAALVPPIMFFWIRRRPDAPELARWPYVIWFLASLLVAWTLGAGAVL